MTSPLTFRLVLALSCVLASGCAFPRFLTGPTPTRLNDLTLGEAQLVQHSQSTSLTVSLGSAFSPQAFNLAWTRAELTLSNDALLSAPLTRSLTQAGGDGISAATARFTGLRPGAGYRLDIILSDGEKTVATGSNAAITLAAGVNAIQVTVTPTAPPAPKIAGKVTTVIRDLFPIPGGVAVGEDGLFYISQEDNIIRKLTPDGTTSDWAPAGDIGFTDIVPAPDGGVYVIEPFEDRLWHVTREKTAVQIAGGFDAPRGLAIDSSGNLYVANENNGNISKITPGGPIEHHFYVGGPGSEALDVTVDGQGNVYALYKGGYVVKIPPNAAPTRFIESHPTLTSLCADATGNVYVANHHRIWVATEGNISPLAGGDSLEHVDGTGTEARFDEIRNLALNATGTILYVINLSSSAIRKIE